MYSAFLIRDFSILDQKSLKYLNDLFRVANDAMRIKSIIEQYEKERDTFIFTLGRTLVTELNLLRAGIGRLPKSKCSFISRDITVETDAILADFDKRFGNVRGHRNVLGHFEDYAFPLSPAARVKPSELKRINAPFDMSQGGSLAGFHANFVGPYFCSSNRKGDICEVYMGPDFYRRIRSTLEGVIALISNIAGGSLSIVHGLNIQALRDLKNAQSAKLSELTDR